MKLKKVAERTKTHFGRKYKLGKRNWIVKRMQTAVTSEDICVRAPTSPFNLTQTKQRTLNSERIKVSLDKGRSSTLPRDNSCKTDLDRVREPKAGTSPGKHEPKMLAAPGRINPHGPSISHIRYIYVTTTIPRGYVALPRATSSRLGEML